MVDAGMRVVRAGLEAHQADPGAGVEQRLDLAAANPAGADDQGQSAIQVEDNREHEDTGLLFGESGSSCCKRWRTPSAYSADSSIPR